MQSILRYHNNKILGIVNGIIYPDIWNPATDKLLAADYDEKSAIKNKRLIKSSPRIWGLDVDEHKMVIGLISRLTNQKVLIL